MDLGRFIGEHAPGGAVIAFSGDLGAGKTTMTKGIAQGLGIQEEVTSPTYTIQSDYQGRLILHHIDAYRLSGADDFLETGIMELLGTPDSLSIIEWSERIAPLLAAGIPKEDLARIKISVAEGGIRAIELEGAWLEELFQ
ncbi:MAG: tRNA (adenosine(37)-N6)-threonylcarbamoyltransferase complex ATPase subunit type 1 TsaE [Spirochaetia bacterium]|nr:tRNA (adenosine(37)-N6)-threonylcarbamoyltransferase complex ATPase subunit type 1 TsaE [Spirochaetia bacterium]